jgi:hypothetical protein
VLTATLSESNVSRTDRDNRISTWPRERDVCVVSRSINMEMVRFFDNFLGGS